DAHDQSTARRAAPRHMRRAQARRPASGAVVCLAVEEPLSGCAGNESARDGHVRMMQAGMESHVMPPPPPPLTLGPGARLKSAREDAGLSIDEVAQQLKLAPRQVRA